MAVENMGSPKTSPTCATQPSKHENILEHWCKSTQDSISFDDMVATTVTLVLLRNEAAMYEFLGSYMTLKTTTLRISPLTAEKVLDGAGISHVAAFEH